MSTKDGRQEPKTPKGEIAWVGYYDRSDNLRYIVTSKPSRDYYFLYELKNGEWIKLGKAKEPPALIEKFHVWEVISV